MKWTYDWLKDYLKTDADASRVADTFTRIGLEVEELIEPVLIKGKAKADTFQKLDAMADTIIQKHNQ